MAEKDEDIFSDKFDKKPDSNVKDHDDQTPPKEPEKETKDDDWKVPDKEDTPKPSGNKKKYIIAVIIGLIVAGGVYGAQQFIEQEEITMPNFFPQPVDPPVQTPVEPPVESKPVESNPIKPSGGGTRDTSSATDKVELEKTNDVIGYYMVTSDGDWYGDFVDFRKVPNKIEESGDLKVNFRCFTDNFQETSTYFATFRNVLENNLSVKVYINGLEVESKSTTTNKALILEGSCYGNES